MTTSVKKPREKTVTVKLSDLTKVCHACGKVKADTQRRTYRSKNYMGRCGDSFCYASCTSSSCRETTAHVCKGCAEKGNLPHGSTD